MEGSIGSVGELGGIASCIVVLSGASEALVTVEELVTAEGATLIDRRLMRRNRIGDQDSFVSFTVRRLPTMVFGCDKRLLTGNSSWSQAKPGPRVAGACHARPSCGDAMSSSTRATVPAMGCESHRISATQGEKGHAGWLRGGRAREHGRG